MRNMDEMEKKEFNSAVLLRDETYAEFEEYIIELKMAYGAPINSTINILDGKFNGLELAISQSELVRLQMLYLKSEKAKFQFTKISSKIRRNCDVYFTTKLNDNLDWKEF